MTFDGEVEDLGSYSGLCVRVLRRWIASEVNIFLHGPESSIATLGEMEINKMLAELREERDQIMQAIWVLERMAVGRGTRRGRPPAWMTAMKRRGRPPGSKNKPKSE